MSAEIWDRVVTSFLEGSFEHNPPFAASAGRHDFDGRLPDWSSEGLLARAAWLRDQRECALAFDPASLDPRRRFEREALIAQTESDLFWLEDGDGLRNPLHYAGALDPALYLTRPYAPLETRLRACIAWARAVPRAAGQIREHL